MKVSYCLPSLPFHLSSFPFHWSTLAEGYLYVYPWSEEENTHNLPCMIKFHLKQTVKSGEWPGFLPIKLFPENRPHIFKVFSDIHCKPFLGYNDVFLYTWYRKVPFFHSFSQKSTHSLCPTPTPGKETFLSPIPYLRVCRTFLSRVRGVAKFVTVEEASLWQALKGAAWREEQFQIQKPGMGYTPPCHTMAYSINTRNLNTSYFPGNSGKWQMIIHVSTIHLGPNPIPWHCAVVQLLLYPAGSGKQPTI